MEPPGATAQGRRSNSMPITELESTAPRLDKVSVVNHRGCTWPLKKTRSQMVAAWQGNGDFARIRQIQDPPVGGVSRSVLQRLLATPDLAPSTPLQSPRRRCSAASAAMVSMVHSPRAFATSTCVKVEKRDPTAQTVPYQCLSPMFSGFGSYESSSSCNSRCSSPTPLSLLPDGPIPSDDEEDVENEDHVTMLRHQVALLVKSLEDEKKRRASEQQLMQTKIIELQSLIRRNSNEVASTKVDAAKKTSSLQEAALTQNNDNEWLDDVRARRWSAPVDEMEGSSSGSCSLQKQTASDGGMCAEAQLTRLKARMHAIDIDAKREIQALRAQLEGVKRSHVLREKQLMHESTMKASALEQKHAIATTRLAQKAADCTALVEKLQTENKGLVTQIQAQEERLKQLEFAFTHKKTVNSSR